MFQPVFSVSLFIYRILNCHSHSTNTKPKNMLTFLTPFLLSWYFNTHPITLLIEILGERVHEPSPQSSESFRGLQMCCIYVTLFACLPLPSLFVRYAHLTVMISLSRERGLLWLRHEPLQSLTLRFGTNSFLLLDTLY